MSSTPTNIRNTDLSIIGVPMDLGASRRGVDMGPSAFRIARLGDRLRALGYKVQDKGNIEVQVAESLEEKNPKAKYVDEIYKVLESLSESVYQTLKEGRRPIILGGDHSIAMGSVSGISRYFREKGKKLGILWFDAHADINTPETSLSGNIHGMPVAHILGLGAKQLLKLSSQLPMVGPKSFVLIGLRDLDPAEREAIRQTGIRAYTMRDIDERGLGTVVQEGIRYASEGTDGIHLSFDMDWVDPMSAPGVGTPVPGGATYREAHLAMELLYDSNRVVSMEVAEVNPVVDVQNQTANLGVEIILSAMGKRIL